MGREARLYATRPQRAIGRVLRGNGLRSREGVGGAIAEHPGRLRLRDPDALPPKRENCAVPTPKEPGMQEFCSRFEASMVRRAGLETFSDGCKVAEYAEETAPAYWHKPAFRQLGPEGCVESDMRYWHGI